MNLIKFLDYFIHESLLENAEVNPTELMRSRVIVAVCLLYLSSLASLIIVFTALALLEILVVWFAVIGSSISLCSYVFQIVFFKKTGNLFWGANIVMMTMFFSTCIFIAITGGWESAVMIIFLTSPLCAFLMEGRRLGIWWTGFTILGYGTYFVLYLQGIEMMQIIDESLLQLFHLVAWIWSWIIIFGGITLYATLNKVLSQHLNVERTKLLQKANYDAQTGAYSRNIFEDMLKSSLKRAIKSREAFIVMDMELLFESDISRSDQELILREAVKELRNAFPERSRLARSGPMSFLIMVYDVESEALADEIASIAHSTLRKVVKSYKGKALVGGVLIPDYTDNYNQIMLLARRAVQDARQFDRGVSVFANRHQRHKDDDSGQWVRARFDDIVFS